MKQLTIAEMSQLAEIDPKAWDRVASHFYMTTEKLKELLQDGAVWIVADEAWEQFTNSKNN